MSHEGVELLVRWTDPGALPDIPASSALSASDPSAEPVLLRLREAVSEPVSAELLVASPIDLGHEALLGAAVSVALVIDGSPARTWHLVLGGVTPAGLAGGALRSWLHLRSPLWLLTHRTNTRKHRNRSTEDIVSGVLAEHGIPFSFQLARPTVPRNYCVQYAETDLDFIHRLLEHEGIHYLADEDGRLLLRDRSEASELLSNQEYNLIESEGALAHAERGIFSIAQTAEIGVGTVTVSDHDWKRPRLDLAATARSADDTDLRLYSFPAGHRDPAEGERLARLRLEAERARALRIDGSGSIPGFSAGHAFRFGDRAGAAFAGEHTLLSVTHEVRRAGFTPGSEGEGEGALTYQNRFEAIPRSVPFRPPMKTPRPVIGGNHTAIVRGPPGEEIHTDEYSRFRAQFHWDREATRTDQDSRWLRLVQENGTSMCFARVGWEMTVGYIDGDPDRPVGLARAINGEMPPTYEPPSRDGVLSIQTRSYPGGGGYNELRMNDAAGRMSIDVRAQKNQSVHAKNDHTESIGNDDTRLCQSDESAVIGNDQAVSIGRDELVKCLGSQTLGVTRDRTLSVGGKEVVSAGSQTVSVRGKEVEQVGSLRLTIAGKIEAPDLIQRAKDALPSLGDLKDAALGAASPVTDLVGSAKDLAGTLKSPPTGTPDLASMDPAAAAEKAKGDVDQWSKAVSSSTAAFAGALGTLRGAGNLGALARQQLSGAVASVKALVPTPAGLADSVTGGLASSPSVEGALDQLMSGSISRSAQKTFTRKVGGAFVATAALGDVRLQHGKILDEVTGGAKVTLVHGTASQTVTGPLAVTVAGMLRRVASERLSYKATDSHVRAGGSATIESDERVDLRATSIRIEGSESLTLCQGKLATVCLAEDAVYLAGKVRLEADTIVVRGGTVDLTKG